MVGWHHRLYGYEFEQPPGNSEGQGSLSGCSPWVCKESDMTVRLNNNNNNNKITRTKQCGCTYRQKRRNHVAVKQQQKSDANGRMFQMSKTNGLSFLTLLQWLTTMPHLVCFLLELELSYSFLFSSEFLIVFHFYCQPKAHVNSF